MSVPWNPNRRLSDAEYRALSPAERKALFAARARARGEGRDSVAQYRRRSPPRYRKGHYARQRMIWMAAIGGAWLLFQLFDALPVWPDRQASAAGDMAAVIASFGACKWGGGTDCVVDGDTIYLGGQKIRIAGIDAPETHDFGCGSELALGERAAERLRELVNSGAITLTSIDRDEDRYGRKLRNVAVDGRDVGEVLVSEGLARDYGSGRRSWC